MRLSFMAICLASMAWAAPQMMGITEEEGIRRVEAHLLIGDTASALLEARELFEVFPKSRAVGGTFIEALSSNGLEKEALRAWNELSLRYPDLIQDRHLIEELSWGVLRKGMDSTQVMVRLAALIGASLTRDSRAVPLLLRMMRDSNAIIRAIAIQMAAGFADSPLKEEIERLMAEEKIWFVRLEVIRAAGALSMKSLAPTLKAILASQKNTFEERQLAIEALVTIYDRISLEELKELGANNRAPMRHLACSLASHFHVKEAKEEIVRLSADTHPDVRVAALNAIGLVYLEGMGREEVERILKQALEDPNPAVAITASWTAALVDPSWAEPYFKRWIENEVPENRRLAAAALAATGGRCTGLGQQMMNSSDPYVRANIALGLIGQRIDVPRCSDILYDFMAQEKQMWMRDNSSNPLFQVLAPSRVRHSDQIPNYPEAVDQMTRLNLVALLAVVEDPRSQEALKSFLQRKHWGITGAAAAMLLQEGDQEALSVVRELLKESDPDVHLQACLVLAMLGRDESVLLDLQKAYIHSNHDRKLHILEALGRIGHAESYSFLIGVLEEPFQILRVAAAAGLIQGVNR